MILIDSSAWVEFLRATGSPAHHRVRELMSAGTATCDPVRMELLAGARSEANLGDLRGLLGRCQILPTKPVDFDSAAMLYRTCRARGETVRKMIDCLIAAIAIREAMPVLHADVDFDVLARHTALEIA